MPKVQVKIGISEYYAHLLKKDIYEDAVCEIMNASAVVFPDEYQRIEMQSHGESDFKNLNTGQMIDGKLLFREKQCYLLAMGEEKLQKWLDSLKDEAAELLDLVKQNDDEPFMESSMYFEMTQRLQSIKKGEDVVFFMPYPLAIRYKSGIIAYLTINVFRRIFEVLQKNQPEITEEKRVYIIYPTTDERVVLAELTSDTVEYLNEGFLAEYVNIEVDYQ